MTLAGTGARLAGEALKSYHGVGAEVVGEKLAAALGNRLSGTAMRFVGPTVQLGGSALVAGAENILSPVLDKDKTKTADFARQPYQPGTLPLTNEQAGYLYLDQMKLQNQMALLQARQELSAAPGLTEAHGRMPVSSPVPQGNPYAGLNQVINATYTY